MRQMVLLVVLAVGVALGAWIPIGPDGGNIMALAIDYSNPATMYCIPYEYPALPRLFRTLDQGANWSAVGALASDRVAGLAVDRHDPQRLYSLTGGNSVMVSSNGGSDWHEVVLPGYGVELKSDPHNSGRVMAAGYSYTSYTQAAALISTDFGESWSVQALGPDTSYAYSLDFDPVNPGVVYVGCYWGMVYRTTDGGATWALRNVGLPDEIALTDISVNPENPEIVVAAADDGIYRTADGGANWTRIGTVARAYNLEFSPAQANLGYLMGYESDIRLFVSTDTGATWTIRQSNLSLGKATTMLADPMNGDGIFLNGGMGVLHSTDQGASWAFRNTGLRIASISTLAVSPGDRQRVYVEVAGNGVFRSSDGGADWTRCEDFLSCGSICGIGVAPGSGFDVLWALEGLG